MESLLSLVEHLNSSHRSTYNELLTGSTVVHFVFLIEELGTGLTTRHFDTLIAFNKFGDSKFGNSKPHEILVLNLSCYIKKEVQELEHKNRIKKKR